MVSSSSPTCPLSSSLLGSSSNPASLSYGSTPPPSSHSMTLVLSSSPPGTSPSSPPTLGLSSNPASVFTLNDTRFELITTWDLTLLAANPNHKLIIYYDNIHATISTHDYRLAKTSLPPLF
ncbi:unnamed protein product [Prunus armeniaca]|uniref:Uncharacterized protein n=1 Tax=Prunus armeniaca TaxID=36596 RepID=A0A6J5TPT0_PRUAR|nr:unnamed protein product [Prunus armeniaca]